MVTLFETLETRPVVVVRFDAFVAIRAARTEFVPAVIAGVTAYNTAKAAAANMTNAAVTSAPAAAVLISPAAS